MIGRLGLFGKKAKEIPEKMLLQAAAAFRKTIRRGERNISIDTTK